MQSLKSTAFAVTLLAISFGLYCVSTNNNPTPESELIEEIKIDSSFATSQSGSMMLPSADLNHQPAPIQISTEVAPAVNPRTYPGTSSPELPNLQIPKLNPPQFSSSTPAALPNSFKPAEPLKLPPLVQTPIQPEKIQTEPLKLPEIAMRQPVSVAPTARDEGLIDALQTGLNDFQQPAVTNLAPPTVGPPKQDDNSFNSQATAVAAPTEEEYRTKNAAVDLAMPGFEAESSLEPAAPTSITGVWSEVDGLVAADEYRKALGSLSKHYGREGLTGPQQQRLQGWLDALAGKVIYSTEHHFVRKPYIVQRGETLESISRQLKIPAEVVYNINKAQFGGSNEVTTGMELKVVNGPFHAEVDLNSKMMTLFVKNLYAGRFPVAVGISGKPSSGNYKVMVKSPKGYTWRDATGKEYPPESPGNGYGPYWIGLSGSLCIHAVPSGTPHGHRGCIGLSEKDANDVFGILSKESQISIVE